MSDIPDFAKLVPGFDFLQGLAKNAGSALPSIGQWVAPTLSPEELQKRIDELKTVQFWLEQNARMLGTTIQALEVQKMTLSTLKTMNVQMADLRDAMKVAPMAAAEPAPAPKPAAGPQAEAAGPPAAPASGVVDPMQWWGALTKQFTQLAASAIEDNTADAARNLAGAMLMKQGMDAAGDTIRQAVKAPADIAAEAMAAAAQGAQAASAKSTRSASGAAARKTPARQTAARAAKHRAS